MQGCSTMSGLVDVDGGGHDARRGHGGSARRGDRPPESLAVGSLSASPRPADRLGLSIPDCQSSGGPRCRSE